MKTNKAAGLDWAVTTEALQAGGDPMLYIIHKFCVKLLFTTLTPPHQWIINVIVPLPIIIIIIRLWSRRPQDFSNRCDLVPKKKYCLIAAASHQNVPERISSTVCVAFLAYASHAVEHTVRILSQVHHHGDEAHDPETSVVES